MSNRLKADKSERGLIGVALLDAKHVMPICVDARLKPTEFGLPPARAVYSLLLDMHTEGKPIDGVSVHERARDSGLEKTLPPGFLMECADSEATAAHAEYYIGVIRTAKQLREVHSEARRIMDEVTAPGAGPELIASQSASRLSQIVERGTPDSRPSSSQVIDNIIQSAERARNEGIPDVGLSILGIRPLDDITMGLEPGLHVLAARPSNGKTTFEDQLAVYHANRGVGVLRICLDMSEQQLAVRALCRDARISVGKLKYGHYTSEDRTVLIRAGEHAKQRPIWYGALYDISEMERYVRVMVAKHPEIGLLTVDYLQLVQASIMGGRAASNDNARISYVCTRLKEIANTLNLPVLALSQLSRTQGSNKADDKFQKPSLQDLRDSGMIEQAAFKVWALWRDPDKTKAWEQDMGLTFCEHNVPCWFGQIKSQNGPLKDIRLLMKPRTFEFWETDDHWGNAE